MNKRRGFDWLKFLQDHRIHYIDRGKNVGEGWVGVKCPLCADDPSEHMGLHLGSGAWSCWRNNEHRGRDPVYLMVKLAPISRAEAERIAGIRHITTDGLSLLMQKLGKMEPVVEQPTELVMPKAIIPINFYDSSGIHHRVLDYLGTRGFDPEDYFSVCQRYDLHHGISGRWHNRLVIPITENGKLMNLVGRHVHRGEPRYRMLSTKSAHEDSPLALKPRRELVGNADKATGGKVLVIVEGPFDCLKLDFYSGRDDVGVIYTFGLSWSERQFAVIQRVASTYKVVVLLLDSTAQVQQYGLASKLPRSRILCGALPEGRKDPGELTKCEVRSLVSSWMEF